MSDAQIGITAIICLFIAIGLRIPIALSLILISTVGITNILGIGPALGLLKSVP